MRVVKKTLLILFGLMAVLAISLFAYKSYRSSQAKKLRIPKETQALLQVQLDDLVWAMAKNSLGNWDAYYGSRKSDSLKTKREKIWNTGVAIPAVISFYALDSLQNEYFTVLQVQDKSKLLNFLKSNLGLQSVQEQEGLATGDTFYQVKQFSLLLHQEKLVISIARNKMPMLEQMIKLAEASQDDWILAREFDPAKEKFQKASITWSDKSSNWLAVDFEAGSAHLAGKITSTLFNFPKEAVTQQARRKPDEILNLEINTDLALLMREHQGWIDSLKLPIDSVDRYVGNYLRVQMLNTELKQSDTIVSYDYDDNFEMVEKKELQETEVPYLIIQVKASPHLLGYLPEKLFYKFHKSEKQGLLRLSTESILPVEQQAFVPTDNVMRLLYQQQPIGAKYLGWINLYDRVKQLEFVGKAANEHTLILSSDVRFSESGLHGLFQLLDL